MSKLIDTVIESIVSDIRDSDLTVLEELLKKLPEEVLFGSLSEEEGEKIKSEYEAVERFLSDYGSIICDDMSSGTNDLMSDNHYSVVYKKQMYFVPKDHILYTDDDYTIVTDLVEGVYED